jgi:hypothetical protein
MLPVDRKSAKEAADTKLTQSTMDNHLEKSKSEEKEKLAPYSDKLLHEAAIEWLIETDQVNTCCQLSKAFF